MHAQQIVGATVPLAPTTFVSRRLHPVSYTHLQVFELTCSCLAGVLDDIKLGFKLSGDIALFVKRQIGDVDRIQDRLAYGELPGRCRSSLLDDGPRC